ncbi:MAG: alpha/beta hydrolase [Anaerolineae bacterium]|nr:alpha/beta hydrolase [Anaerolineae bacterium]
MNTADLRRPEAPLARGGTGGSPDTERLERLAFRLGIASAALTAWLHLKPTTRGLASNLLGYGLKVVSGAIAPLLSAMGLAGALVASQRRRPWRSLPGWIGALLGVHYLWRVCSQAEMTAPDDDTCGSTHHEADIPFRANGRRARPRLRPRMTRDLTYATVPGLNRDLLCDLWEPDPDMDRSGLSIIYIHGGAWQSFDKDVMTRPFFRHLTAQGHVVMDIAYRLAGETDMCGMLGDVKRAIAWVKGNHATLGVDPARVVLSGGSAGAHLALLAAYTPNTSGFDPDDTLGCDTSACAVVAFYPVADLRTLTSYWSEQAMHPLATALGKVSGLLPEDGYLPWSRLALG